MACDNPRPGVVPSGWQKREKRRRPLCGGESTVLVCVTACYWHLEQRLLDGVLRQPRCYSIDSRDAVCKLPVRVAALYGDRFGGEGAPIV